MTRTATGGIALLALLLGILLGLLIPSSIAYLGGDGPTGPMAHMGSMSGMHQMSGMRQMSGMHQMSGMDSMPMHGYGGGRGMMR